MYLPHLFQEKMQNLLADEWECFAKSLQGQSIHGLRVNTLKITVEDFLKIAPFQLTPIPWTRDGFYIDAKERPGKHPYYLAGLYYIQEPSAMLPAEIINVQPGEKVLDLCAAPGGKSAQIAAQLKNQGLLVSNDINTERTKALARNLALLGVENALILNESPQKLAQVFPNWFDAILVDAPCSGEGMFRRDEQAPKSWEAYGPASCVPLQKEILNYAAEMLKPGGRLVYSTCTFSPEEDEGSVANFLAAHPDFTLLPISKQDGLDNGRPKWADGNPDLLQTLRAWPHKIQGEGHFCALFLKKTTDILNEGNGESILDTKVEEKVTKSRKKKEVSAKKIEVQIFENELPDLSLWEEFCQENLKFQISGPYSNFGQHYYRIHDENPDLSGVKIVRQGFYLGEFKKKRFEPSHALALTLKKDEVIRSLELTQSDSRLERYLKGETIYADISNGWVLITNNSFGIGWGKAVEGIVKNHYPKGWRRT